ncbi:unnamed protein product [Caenorhabditis auriculariae]|uniref:Homeobox domain-containing protein n=1 Tax=Caenorhabditis auriculariae TaxID=2777116 RepID=A0A8S1H207_9PELO|nr:unnamed protein product [Caenorhabditis auriculariae]
MDWPYVHLEVRRLSVDEEPQPLPSVPTATAPLSLYHTHFNHFHMAAHPEQPENVGQQQQPPPPVVHYDAGSDYGAVSKRRFRTNFTEAQAFFLEEAFRESHYPDHKAKKEMAVHLNLPEDRITLQERGNRSGNCSTSFSPENNYSYCIPSAESIISTSSPFDPSTVAQNNPYLLMPHSAHQG